MNKQRTFRYALIAAVAAAVTVPLIAQVKHAQDANHQAQQAAAEVAAQPAAPAPPVGPATKPVEVDPNKVILTQGDVSVTAGEFSSVVTNLPPQYQAALSDPAVKKRIADRIVQVKQLAAEARKRDLQDKPQVKQQIEMQTDQVLVNALMQDVQGGQNEKDQRAYFDANKSNFEDVKARHILIRTPGSPVPVEAGKKELTDAEAKAKADQIEQRLAKGEDFATIAKAESDDKGSGLKGGDLGTFAPWKMDSTFSKAALGLQKNQISEPVKTQFGYHIIQLLDHAPRSYEQAKDEVGEARWSQIVNSLKDQGKPEYDPTFFGDTAEKASPGASTQPAANAAPAH
ncbi:MAG TPA: peptidylprolyl isomerase [Tepidisphaeraceae bacterium]|nr:peptidylprolyl isomerase [Tepidisphaeraceae bacterium]